jgi:GT2 family glycosyltransferase
MPEISFLILTYNSEKYIDPLFESLKSEVGEKIKSGEYEVIVVDNDSKDATAEKVKKYTSSSIRFVQSGENGGYAKGINKAAALAKGDYLVVINPDSMLIKSDFSKAIDEFKHNPKMGIAGFALQNKEGVREKTAGTFYNFFNFPFFVAGFEEMVGLRFSPNIKKKVDYISGGFVMFRTSVFMALKGFDEDYFMYVEDMDICFRAKKAGFDTMFLPYCVIEHKGQGSSSREFAIVNIFKGLVLFYKKHGSFFEELYIRNLLSIKAALIIFVGSVLGRRDLVATYQNALRSIS